MRPRLSPTSAPGRPHARGGTPGKDGVIKPVGGHEARVALFNIEVNSSSAFLSLLSSLSSSVETFRYFVHYLVDVISRPRGHHPFPLTLFIKKDLMTRETQVSVLPQIPRA